MKAVLFFLIGILLVVLEFLFGDKKENHDYR